MGLVTDSITYNVKHRGRKARGQERNFDTAALATLINGPAVQERVRHGDMLGYFGHWPRIKLGMDPGEGGLVDGAVVAVEPALRTVELRADADGTISHKAEFLDTEPGQIAERLYRSKAGGFSSAIESVPRTAPSVPRGFYGFDYVLEPNYSSNRGHKVLLDSAGQPVEAEQDLAGIMDSVLAHSVAGEYALLALFDSLQQQHSRALEALQHLDRQNEVLVDRLSRSGRTLDSLEDVRQPPNRAQPHNREELTRFRGLPLAPLTRLVDSAADEGAEGRAVLEMYGLRG